MGMGGCRDRAGEGGETILSVICLRFKSKLLTDEKKRCLSGLSPARQASV